MSARRRIQALATMAVPWNILGVVMFLAEVGALPGGGPPPGGAELPAAIKVCFGIGAVTGLAGAMGLALLRRWARPALWVSLTGLLIDWTWVFGFSGAASILIGVAVLSVAALLVVLAELAVRGALLR